MKRIYWGISLLVLISMPAAIIFTASDYVNCQDNYPDEFLDLALGYQNSIPPILVPHGTFCPFINRSLITLDPQRSALLTTFLRC